MRKLKITGWIILGFIGLVSLNWIVQAFLKPSEIVGVADSHFYKPPRDTWAEYGSLFKKHATSITTPEFLAALAQIESAGNPIARTRWSFHFSWNPFKIYRPDSSSVGMYQMTDAAYDQARHYCIHSGKPVLDGPWYQMNGCWFNFSYNRLIPNHAIEMTSAYLTARTLKVAGETETRIHQQRTAAVLHFCGEEFAKNYVKSGYRVKASDLCGDSPIDGNLKRMDDLMTLFASIQK